MSHMNRAKTALEVFAIALLDAASLVAVFKAATFLRLEVLPAFYSGFPASGPSGSVLKVWWVFLLWGFFLLYEGLYTRRFSFWDEIKALWRSAFLATAGVLVVTSLGKLSSEISRTVVLLTGVLALAFLPVTRMLGKKLLRRAGLLKRRVLVLGAGETGRLISNALKKEPNYGYAVIGYLDDDPAKVGSSIDGIKVHRGTDQAVRYLARARITDLIIAMPGAGGQRLQELINALQHKAARVLLVPDIFGMAVLGTSLQHFFQEQAIALEVRNNLARPFNQAVKRVFDYTLGVVLFVLLALPLALLAAMVKATSEGPALFAQERVGKGGRVFRCYKFRTMYRDAEERLRDILTSDPGAREEWEAHWKFRDDPRVTPLGRILRTTSLDELPQLLNVLRGDMSLVGPRPYLPREKNFLVPSGETLLSVLPGITGLWQVSGRSNTSYTYRISLDTWYVRNWNLWLDVVILLKTVSVVLRREGAN